MAESRDNYLRTRSTPLMVAFRAVCSPGRHGWKSRSRARAPKCARARALAASPGSRPATSSAPTSVRKRSLPSHPQALLTFAEDVRTAAENGAPLHAPLLARAESIHRALFQGGIDALRRALQPGSGEPLLVRLRIRDAELRKVPWEAIAAPGQVKGFLGIAADLLLARAPDGESSDDRRPVREVRDALRVLVVAPDSSPTMNHIQAALQQRIEAGEVVLDTREGLAAEPRRLLEYLRAGDAPNILHFVCHGRVVRGAPALLLGDADDDSMWLSVSVLAQHLEMWCSGPLRLVVLEACAGADPTDVASAAEILVRNSVDAVVAHLWPVEHDVARVCSVQFYGALAAANRAGGSVGVALNDSRRLLLAERGESARAFSPVLYLRTGTTALFNLRQRKLVKPAPPPVPRASTADPALAALLQRPFAVMIGDRGGAEGAALDDLQKRLTTVLSQPVGHARSGLPLSVPPGLPLSALAQRVAFHCGSDVLGEVFQETFLEAAVPPAPRRRCAPYPARRSHHAPAQPPV
ncbi:CHAT domain-containing protein [Sorangium sp. So ce1151]|uniref:CHAT domain-containing protein n=1 Tax=Sorangium sp. So ce1151 TaxID=3133332 RepID=UPI003F5F3C5C